MKAAHPQQGAPLAGTRRDKQPGACLSHSPSLIKCISTRRSCKLRADFTETALNILMPHPGFPEKVSITEQATQRFLPSPSSKVCPCQHRSRLGLAGFACQLWMPKAWLVWRIVFPGHPRGGLADDLDGADQREQHHLIAVQVAPLPSRDKALCSLRRVDHTTDAVGINAL